MTLRHSHSTRTGSSYDPAAASTLGAVTALAYFPARTANISATTISLWAFSIALFKFTAHTKTHKDYQIAFLHHYMGGCAVAHVAYCILYVPSIDTTKAYIRTQPIRASVGAPTLSKMKHKLSVCSLTAQFATTSLRRPVYAMVLQIDEPGSHHQYDPRTLS